MCKDVALLVLLTSYFLPLECKPHKGKISVCCVPVVYVISQVVHQAPAPAH